MNRETQLLGQALRPFLTTHRLPVPEIHRLSEDNMREGFFSRAEVPLLGQPDSPKANPRVAPGPDEILRG